jgi:hypothetical protein
MIMTILADKVDFYSFCYRRFMWSGFNPDIGVCSSLFRDSCNMTFLGVCSFY